MKELAKHIEVLLLENDCVIVPGLGGFIAHSKQAEFKVSANIFCPPQRTIGFNPQLVMNDGLLVQSYMQSYNTDFPDATRKIETVVSSIKESLYQNGQAELDNIGTLYYTMNGMYGFEPCYSSFFTPHLFGLGNFTLSPLNELKKEEKVNNEIPRITIQTATPMKEDNKAVDEVKHSVLHRLLRHSVGIAAALILFFILSVPVENTYLDNADYASLGAETMLDAIRSKSVVVNNTEKEQQAKVVRTKNNVNTLKPVSVKSVKVEKESHTPNADKSVAAVATASNVTTAVTASNVKPEAKLSAKPVTGKGSYVIVASLQSMKDAENELSKFKKMGYDEAEIVSSNEHFRISLFSYKDKKEAYTKVNELRKEERFKNAWVFNKTK